MLYVQFKCPECFLCRIFAAVLFDSAHDYFEVARLAVDLFSVLHRCGSSLRVNGLSFQHSMTESHKSKLLLGYPVGQSINLIFIDMFAAWMLKVLYKSPYCYWLKSKHWSFGLGCCVFYYVSLHHGILLSLLLLSPAADLLLIPLVVGVSSALFVGIFIIATVTCCFMKRLARQRARK